MKSFLNQDASVNYKAMWTHLKDKHGYRATLGFGCDIRPLDELMAEYEGKVMNKLKESGEKEIMKTVEEINNNKMEPIKLYTSYFSNHRKFGDNLNATSIATNCPPGFNGDILNQLAPNRVDLLAFKSNNITESDFEKRYLDKLKRLPNEFFEENLKNNTVLLCWEKPEKYCHRHVLSKFIKDVFGKKYSTKEL